MKRLILVCLGLFLALAMSQPDAALFAEYSGEIHVA